MSAGWPSRGFPTPEPRLERMPVGGRTPRPPRRPSSSRSGNSPPATVCGNGVKSALPRLIRTCSPCRAPMSYDVAR